MERKDNVTVTSGATVVKWLREGHVMEVICWNWTEWLPDKHSEPVLVLGKQMTFGIGQDLKIDCVGAYVAIRPGIRRTTPYVSNYSNANTYVCSYPKYARVSLRRRLWRWALRRARALSDKVFYPDGEVRLRGYQLVVVRGSLALYSKVLGLASRYSALRGQRDNMDVGRL